MRSAAVFVAALAAVSACGRIGYGLRADGGDSTFVDAPGFSLDATVFGDGIVAPSCGTTALLSDGFDDGVAGPDFTAFVDPGISVAELTSRLVIAFAASVPDAHYGGYASVAAFDPDGICAVAELAGVPADNGDAFIKLAGAVQQLEFFTWRGVLQMRTHQGDDIDVLVAIPFDLTAHRFWRLRETAGVSYWDVSADDVTYFTLASTRFLTDPTVQLSLGAGAYHDATNAGSAAFASTRVTGP